MYELLFYTFSYVKEKEKEIALICDINDQNISIYMWPRAPWMHTKTQIFYNSKVLN